MENPNPTSTFFLTPLYEVSQADMDSDQSELKEFRNWPTRCRQCAKNLARNGKTPRNSIRFNMNHLHSAQYDAVCFHEKNKIRLFYFMCQSYVHFNYYLDFL